MAKPKTIPYEEYEKYQNRAIKAQYDMRAELVKSHQALEYLAKQLGISEAYQGYNKLDGQYFSVTRLVEDILKVIEADQADEARKRMTPRSKKTPRDYLNGNVF